MKKHSPFRLTGLSAAVALGCGLLVTPTVQAMIDSDLYAFNDEIELSDEELGGLRGKYISGNQITYFGVEMYTKVASASGQTTTAGLAFSADVVSANDIRPTVTIFHSSSSGDGSVSDVGSGLSRITSGGLNNIQGISQSIQVAGDLNDISNDFVIDISSDVDDVGNRFTDMQVGFNLNTVGTTSILGDAGTTTTFSLNKEGFGYTVALPGDVDVSQNVRNAALNQANGISQRVQVSSNQYQVSNVIHLVARQQAGSGLQGAGLDSSALTSLRGLQSIGRL